MTSPSWVWVVDSRLERRDRLGETAPAFGGAVVGAAGQADQHPVVVEHHLCDGEGQLGVAIAAAVGYLQREPGGPVEVAQPAPAGATQNQIG